MKCHKCKESLYYSGGCLGEWEHLTGSRECKPKEKPKLTLVKETK